jgi:hypothetical protein
MNSENILKEFGVSNIMIDRCAIDNGSSSFEMGKACFGDIKHGEDIRVERILKLFC